MALHWTYADFDRDGDLEQGDILAPTPELRGVLDQVHKHFCDAKYLGFLVTTQSCDLVRRKGRPKATYISIATVRPLVQVLPKLFSGIAAPVRPGVFVASARPEAHDLLMRVFNQNEQALGLFYLHSDADAAFGEDAVSFLRVSVALRAEHYEVLLRARRGRLKPEFQTKLGWLVGNLYARPASPDWADHDGGKKQLRDMVGRCLDEHLDGSGPVWVDDELVEGAKKAKVDLGSVPLADIKQRLEAFRSKPPIERALDEVAREFRKSVDAVRSARTVRERGLGARGVRPRAAGGGEPAVREGATAAPSRPTGPAATPAKDAPSAAAAPMAAIPPVDAGAPRDIPAPDGLAAAEQELLDRLIHRLRQNGVLRRLVGSRQDAPVLPDTVS